VQHLDTNLLAVAERWLINKDNVGLVVEGSRMGARSFVTFLEYRRFPPDTPLNTDFNLCMMLWGGLVWWLVIIPSGKLYQADEQLKQLGMRRADGVPHMITMENGNLKHEHFPLDLPNVCTIENVPGHFAYHNDPALNKTAKQFEDEACDRVIEEFDARRKARVARFGDSVL
jgi:hypothetical protein